MHLTLVILATLVTSLTFKMLAMLVKSLTFKMLATLVTYLMFKMSATLIPFKRLPSWWRSRWSSCGWCRRRWRTSWTGSWWRGRSPMHSATKILITKTTYHFVEWGNTQNVQYLANNNGDNLPKSIKNSPKKVPNFAKY